MSLSRPTRRDRVRERLTAAALQGVLASLDDDTCYETLTDEDADLLAAAAARVADAALRRLYP